MECMDFDKQFERYTRDWMAKNAEKYHNDMDVIEAMMPDVYMEFMSKPAAWLNGLSPEAYFEQFDDAGMLVDWMCAYYAKQVPVPDLLLERITSLGSAAEEKLLALPFGADVPHEAALTAISLLRELDSCAPMQAYIEYISTLTEADEKGDMCAESLLSMGYAVVEPILAVLDDAKDAARDIFADILSNFPGDDRIFDLLMERFAHCEDRHALFASYLAKFGDDRALPALLAAAMDDNTHYLDYVEIVSAIDELGGERPPERDFHGDPYYESLRRV
ncbi:MAG: hypothetical protein U0J65_11315 [Christensenellales bacterium]|nr:hypothetical protein [Christensenellales bacterium]